MTGKAAQKKRQATIINVHRLICALWHIFGVVAVVGMLGYLVVLAGKQSGSAYTC